MIGRHQRHPTGMRRRHWQREAPKLRRLTSRILAGIALAFAMSLPAHGEPPPLRIEDPFAAVDGQPVTIGRLNLVLKQKFGNTAPDRLPDAARQATALILVRQQMAMNQLEKIGGEALKEQIDQAVAAQALIAQQRGVSLAQQAAAMNADQRALTDQIRWQTAWAAYLKSRLTRANLQRYFESHRNDYPADSLDELTDWGPIRRDATAALFNGLVRAAGDTKVAWFSEALRPPAGYEAHVK